MFSISLWTTVIPWRNWKQWLCKILQYGQCESCELPSHGEKLVSIPYVSVQCGFVMKGQCLFQIACSIHFGVSSYTSLRASGSRLLCCPLLSWIKGSSVVPQMRNIYTMLKLPTLVYVLQVGRPLPVQQCSVKLLSMLIGFCTCKVRNILTLISLFSVCRWLMELQVSTVLPLSFQQVNRSMFWRANARASGEVAWGQRSFLPRPSHPRLLSRAALAWLLATLPNGELARRHFSSIHLFV